MATQQLHDRFQELQRAIGPGRTNYEGVVAILMSINQLIHRVDVQVLNSDHGKHAMRKLTRLAFSDGAPLDVVTWTMKIIHELIKKSPRRLHYFVTPENVAKLAHLMSGMSDDGRQVQNRNMAAVLAALVLAHCATGSTRNFRPCLEETGLISAIKNVFFHFSQQSPDERVQDSSWIPIVRLVEAVSRGFPRTARPLDMSFRVVAAMFDAVAVEPRPFEPRVANIVQALLTWTKMPSDEEPSVTCWNFIDVSKLFHVLVVAVESSPPDDRWGIVPLLELLVRAPDGMFAALGDEAGDCFPSKLTDFVTMVDDNASPLAHKLIKKMGAILEPRQDGPRPNTHRREQNMSRPANGQEGVHRAHTQQPANLQTNAHQQQNAHQPNTQQQTRQPQNMRQPHPQQQVRQQHNGQQPNVQQHVRQHNGPQANMRHHNMGQTSMPQPQAAPGPSRTAAIPQTPPTPQNPQPGYYSATPNAFSFRAAVPAQTPQKTQWSSQPPRGPAVTQPGSFRGPTQPPHATMPQAAAHPNMGMHQGGAGMYPAHGYTSGAAPRFVSGFSTGPDGMTSATHLAPPAARGANTANLGAQQAGNHNAGTTMHPQAANPGVNNHGRGAAARGFPPGRRFN